jgi:hypothetical protein
MDSQSLQRVSKGFRCVRAVTLAILAIWSTVAAAQLGTVSPPRGRELAQVIQDAGFDCPQVAAVEVAPSPQPGFDSFRPEIAICRNGKRFLVARSGRSGGNVRPVVRPLP